MIGKELERLGDDAREAALGALSTARTVVLALLLLGWSAGWGAAILVGYLLALPGLMEAGGVVLGVSWAAVAAGAVVRRRKRAVAARSSLIVQAQLERLRLTPEMRGVLSAFDVADQRSRALLALPELAGQASGSGRDGLGSVRGALLALAREEASLQIELRKMRAHPGLASTSAARDDLERRLAKLRADADQIALDAQRYSALLGEIRELSSKSIEAQAGPVARLAETLEHLDRTAAAYHEIARTEST